jgi:hypothetical protein
VLLEAAEKRIRELEAEICAQVSPGSSTGIEEPA